MGEGRVESGGRRGRRGRGPGLGVQVGVWTGGRDSRSFSQKLRPGNQGW